MYWTDFIEILIMMQAIGLILVGIVLWKLLKRIENLEQDKKFIANNK